MSMDGVLKLYFGESNLPTPEFIKRAAQKAMADGYTFYTENAGLPSLRKALARYYQELHAVEFDAASEIVITASGVQALHLAIRCVLDPGDEALVLTPAWPNGAANIAMANAVPIEIAQPLVGDRYQIDFAALEAAVTPRTRMLLYTSPSNPLGWVATIDEQRQLLEFARRHGLWLMADEVYERLNYTGPKPTTPAPTILKLATRDDAVIVMQSFSKAYCMTGWRLGWLVARRDLAARATQLNEFVVSHAPSFTQRAGRNSAAVGRERARRNAGALARRIATFVWPRWRRCRASPFPSRTARSICSPRSPAPPTHSISASGCCSRPMSDWRRALLSEPAAKARCESATPPIVRFWKKPWRASACS